MPKELSTLQSKTGTRSSRVLSILDLFTVEAPRWTVDMMAGRVAVAPATVYRYVRDLCTAGFLVQAAGGGYVLGPRFVEVDRQIRIADPLLRVGQQWRSIPTSSELPRRSFARKGTVVASLCTVRPQKAASTAVPSYASAHQPR